MEIRDLITLAGGQSKLAARLGVSHASVYDWKTAGSIPPRHIEKICQEFNLSSRQIMGLVSWKNRRADP